MKVRVNNKKVFILMLIILLLILAVGYSVFSEILTISGTANAKGTFDLEFQNAEIVKNIGADKEKTTVEISENKNTLTVNVGDLAYPGAGVEFSVDIVNVGTMPAEVQAVTPDNITGSDKIKVTGLDGIKVGHPKIEVGDRCNIHFTVEWPEDVTDISESESTISFGLQIEYTQATGGTGGEIIPDYTVPTGLTAVYGNTLTDVQLPEGFKFQDSLTTPVGNAGTNSFKVTYTSEDGIEVKDITVSIEVGKANPGYVLPTGITATYGKTLANVELPEGFKFQDSLETSVGNVGTNKFKVIYTPTDTDNYNEIKDIEISVTVKYDTLVNQITISDYGKSINYKARVKNNATNVIQEVSNWKLLYKDENKIYIILDDFLPNNLVPATAGLSTSGTHVVNSQTDRTTLLNGLRTTSHWSEFANGVTGAVAQGAPEFDILMKSYNEKHNASMKTDSTIEGDFTTDNTDTLYIPYTSEQNGVRKYWLAAEYPNNVNYVWGLSYNRCGGNHHYDSNAGVRPVVSLPSSITGTVGETVEIK